jgi:hypothetical protein
MDDSLLYFLGMTLGFTASTAFANSSCGEIAYPKYFGAQHFNTRMRFSCGFQELRGSLTEFQIGPSK